MKIFPKILVQPINIYTKYYEATIITVPREFKNLFMTSIGRIAHSPADAECMAGFLIMQVIIVGVADAAQKTWSAERMVHQDPAKDETPGASSSPPGAGSESNGPIRSGCPGIPRRAL
jgi:hypothetical protein